MTAILITDVQQCIQNLFLYLFPFVLLQYSHELLLMQQRVICDFVRALAAKKKVNCTQSSYRRLSYTEFINKLHFCAQNLHSS